MKIALIGCGRVSKNHIKAATLNNLEIVALCDLIPQKAEKLISEFPSAKSVVIPETGHNSFIEAPEKVSEALDEFIGK